MEPDSVGHQVRAYTYYPGIDQPHSVREFTGNNAGRYYFAMELPGHVTGLLNASGARVNQYRYSAYGKIEHVYETVPNPLRYMAREWDPDAEAVLRAQPVVRSGDGAVRERRPDRLGGGDHLCALVRSEEDEVTPVEQILQGWNRVRSHVCAGALILAACGAPAEEPPASKAAPPPPCTPSRDGCIAPEPDSASAVRAAQHALTTPADADVPLRVSSFVRHHEGTLISLVPDAPRVLIGGGGLIWVDRDGCVTVIKRGE